MMAFRWQKHAEILQKGNHLCPHVYFDGNNLTHTSSYLQPLQLPTFPKQFSGFADNQLVPSDPCPRVSLSTLHIPMNPRTGQFSPSSPRQTRENPTVAPTMLWLADTGSFRNVAPSSNTQLPTVTTWLSWSVSSEHTVSQTLSASVYQQLAGISPHTVHTCLAPCPTRLHKIITYRR